MIMSTNGIPPGARKPPARVLVVEDDASTSDALMRLLRHHGFDVLIAGSVREAMEHLRSRPDHILLDLMLPDGDGTVILEHVRQAGLESRVLVITGVGDPEQIARVVHLRPEAVLRKPVEFSQILEKLSRVA
jgi:two-component system OmpR family response regulator